MTAWDDPNEPAITLQQPWAWAIFHAGKDVENRSWKPRHRGRLWIHAGMTKGRWPDWPAGVASPPDGLPRGVVLDYVTLVDCVKESVSPWAVEGSWHWLLEDPVVLAVPFERRGVLGLSAVGRVSAERKEIQHSHLHPATWHYILYI